MKALSRRAFPVLLAGSILITTASPASGVVLARHCDSITPDVHWCASVVRRLSGRILFKVSTSGYFHPMEACVWKLYGQTTCAPLDIAATDGVSYFIYRVSWQGNFPNKGAGTYFVEMHMKFTGNSLTGGYDHPLLFRVS